jgi:NAD(P)H-flavin reductase
MIATRMRNTAFKRVLKTLPLGSEVKVEGPFGISDCTTTWRGPRLSSPAELGSRLSAASFKQAVHEKRRHRIVFYANRRPEDAVFLEEMRALAQDSPTFTFVPTMTEMGKSNLAWDGEQGRIDQQMLAKYLAGITSAIYFVTGPSGMVKGLRTLLNDAGIDRDDIRTEEFTGY